MKHPLYWLPAAALLGGCVTLVGVYELSVHDAQGAPLDPGMSLVAKGTGIYNVRNALCTAHPGATVIIRDAESGEELKSESPYRC